MTAKQKAARAKFKAVVKEAGKLRKKNPKLTQAQAVKQAWAISYSKKKAGKSLAGTKTKKKAPAKSYHKDTKSHNVRISVMSGVEKSVINKGDFLVCTWGYDQTNVDFYYVTKISKGWAYIIPAGNKILEYNSNYMSGRVIPAEPKFTAKPMRKKIKKYSDQEYVGISTYSVAFKYDGKPVTFTNYA